MLRLEMLALLALLLIATCGRVAARTCYTGSSDCFGGNTVTDSTYDVCCGPLRIDSSVRRSFELANGVCSECLLIGLDEAQYTLNENNTVYMRRLRLLAPSNPVLFARPRLRLNGILGTASVNDFSIVTSDILLRSLVIGIDVAITISIDIIAGEPPETFTISSQPPAVSSPSDPLFLFRDTTVTIIDSDKPTYEFTEGDYTGNEDTGRPVVVTVRQTVSSVQDIHLLLVPLTYAEYIARAAIDPELAGIDVYHRSRPDAAEHDTRRDFNKTTQDVFFPANSPNGAERSVSFSIFDDAIDEEPEGFIIVLYPDTNLTSIEVAFTPNLRTTLGRINDNDPFYFGFVVNEVTYDEANDEGLQELLYSPAPGNKTEKSFDFSLNLNRAIAGGFVFGADGDITFGAGVIRPTFRFRADDLPEDRVVTFVVINDNIVEGQEIGQLQIARSTSFDGFEPLFQNVRIIINDSNRAEFNLSAPTIVFERDRGFTATVDMTAPIGGTTFQIEIDIMEREITATPNADFRRIAPPSFIFQGTVRPGCCLRTAPYLVRDDNIAEPDEVLEISISRGVASTAIPVDFVIQRMNVTIIDDDMATIGFESTMFNVSEGAGFADIPVAVLGSTTLGGDVIVRFNTSDLLAIAGSDYSDTVIELTFNAAVRRQVVRVPIIQDSLSELDEQFRANLVLVENNGINVLVDSDEAVVTIEDDDVTVIGFDRESVIVNEADGTATLTVRVLMGELAPGATAEVEFNTADRAASDTSAIASGDYISVTGHRLSFSSGATSFNVSIPIINDDITELTESFLANLRLISADTSVRIAPEQATVNIENDDQLWIGFVQSIYSGLEGGFVRPVIAILSRMIAPGLTISVQFSNFPATATSPADYVKTVETLHFSSSMTSHTVSVPLNTDSVYENTEAFLGAIALIPTPLNVLVSPNRATLLINDNTSITIGFRVSSRDVVESVGNAVLIAEVTGGQLGRVVTLQYSTSDKTATSNMDFTAVSGSITFSPSLSQQSILVPIIDDAVREDRETLTVSLTGAPDRVMLFPAQGTIGIIDNDGRGRIGFGNITFSVREGAGFAELPVTVLGTTTLGGEVTVRFSTSDISATAGSDYSSTVMNLRFSNSVQHTVVRIPINQDVFSEGTEQFRASLSLVESNGINVDVSPNQTTVDIIDDDELWIGFTQFDYTGLEGDFVQPIVKVLSGKLATGVTVAVRFETAYIQAIATFDFKQTDQILDFSSINTSITVPVPLLSDSIYEHTEVFFSSLRRQPTPLNVHVFPDRSVLYIIDNSNVTIGFRVSDIHVTEHVGNAMLIVEVKKGKLSRTISLQYSTLEGTARAGMDHTTTTGTITFTPTTTQQTISIPIINDMVRESRETLTVRLTNAPTRVLLAPDKAWISIIDNDTVAIGFVPKRSVSSEESGRGQFTIRVISGRLDSTTSVVVLLNTASCTADSEIDFRPLQDVRLVFNSTQLSITVPFDIINDDLVEHDEALMASIKLAVPVARVSLAPDEAELTITDTVDRGFRG